MSWVHTLNPHTMVFVRGGMSHNGGALLSKSLSVGTGYVVPDRKDLLGVGLNWGRPNQELYGDAKDQWTSEIFYRYQLNRSVQLTPSVQYIVHPALLSDTTTTAVFGLRAQIAF